MKGKQIIDIEQLQTGFDRGFRAMDELRASHLDDTLKLQSAKNQVYAREYDTLAKKYGELHPRVIEMKAKIEVSDLQLKHILIERKTAATAGSTDDKTNVEQPRPDKTKSS